MICKSDAGLEQRPRQGSFRTDATPQQHLVPTPQAVLDQFAMSGSLVAPATAAATIYKSVDSEGNVTFSDQPPGDAELVEILDYQTVERRPEDIERRVLM